MMIRMLTMAAVLAGSAPALAQTTPPPGEQPVEAYVQSNANAGASPLGDTQVFDAFHGKAGIDRIVDDLVARIVVDPRIAEVFKATDLVRLRRTLKEQVCYVLGGPCAYTGRDMRAAHKDQGLQNADFNALVENLQKAMDKEGVPFRAQNRLLAKLAPMQRDTVER